MRELHFKLTPIARAMISNLKFDLRSRAGLPRLLMGLKEIFCDLACNKKLLQLLSDKILPGVRKTTGRPGMPLWTIFVCGLVRLELNISYDHLENLANNHCELRAILGHGAGENYRYGFRSLMENVRRLTPELLDEISKDVVCFGHSLITRKKETDLHARCDSFVVETNVHFPSDITLLLDAMRKIISLTAQWCELCGLTDWRQCEYNIRHLKKLMRVIQNKKHNKGCVKDLSEQEKAPILLAYQNYLDAAAIYMVKARLTVAMLGERGEFGESDKERKETIESFFVHAVRQIDQTKRRVINGEVIPAHEKVYSVFETHTEWKSKGKAGVLVELGLNVAIVEDQYRFILHHLVMQKMTDVQIAVEIVMGTKSRFPEVSQVSFDKGFQSKPNREELGKHLVRVVMPRKGKLTQAAKDEEREEHFVKARRAHSAVESAINALEVHGLDVCPDRGIDGFKRYVSLAVVARNIHRLGDILWQRACDQERRRGNRAANDPQSKLTA